jgi:tRNA(Ile)-lysidine synthase
MITEMLNEIKQFLAGKKLVKPGERILLAVSGGIDSMVMADLFIRLGIESGIAHCNFTLRAAESDKDEELVRTFAADHNLPYYSERFATKDYAAGKGISVQMAARELRYNWFWKICRENGYDKVAVAHNLNDNIETLIINLVRGTGITGLAGMQPVNDKIIRPLLFATRDEIDSYSRINRIAYREDSSNKETRYVRNKIRHLVIPVLKEINPSVETTLNLAAGRFADLDEMITDYVSGLTRLLTRQKEGDTIFNIRLLKPYLRNKSLIFELFRPFGISGPLVADLIKVVNGRTGSKINTESHRIIRNRDELIVTGSEAPCDYCRTIRNITDLRKLPEIASVRSVTLTGDFKVPSDPLTACLDFEILTFPLILRNWKKGDYFHPLGMSSKKKLSDYFTDRKYSAIDKERQLIMESGGKIAWIVGERIDHRFRITCNSRKALIIKALNSQSEA